MKIAEIQKIMGQTFQRVATEEISLLLFDAITGGKYLQPYILTGYAGLGKTYLVELMASILAKHGYTYKEIPVGCTAAHFWSLLRDADEYTLFFGDECHAFKCANQLKAVTETGGKAKTFNPSVNGEEIEITVDPSKWIFILASNETVKDTAISGESGRFRELALQPYGEQARVELLKILGKQYEVELPTGDALKFIAQNVRPFARAIKNILHDLRLHCTLNNEKLTTIESVRKALAAREYFPQGFTRKHIEVLKFVGSDKKGKQVQEIAAAPLQGVQSKTASAILAELLQPSFIATGNNGRKMLSQKGFEYLTSLSAPKTKATK